MAREEKLPPGVYRRKDWKFLWIHDGYRGRDYRESAETGTWKHAAAQAIAEWLRKVLDEDAMV
jgi:hypothetical protein